MNRFPGAERRRLQQHEALLLGLSKLIMIMYLFISVNLYIFIYYLYLFIVIECLFTIIYE